MISSKRTSLLMLCLIFITISAISWSATTTEPRIIIFATSFPQDSFFYKKYKDIYKEAFKRLGYQFKLEVFPSKRLAQAVNSGIIDGDASRIKQMNSENHFPNMRIVNEAITAMNISAFTNNKILKINDWVDLKHNDLKIAYPRGYRIVEINLPKVASNSRIIKVSDSMQGTRMLNGDRFDILIDVKRTVEVLLQKTEFTDHKVKHAGILETIILYPYLHKKNAHLVQKLAHALKNMKEDGQFQKIIDTIK